MVPYITGDQFLAALVEAGVIRAQEKIIRVVIDARVHHPVRIYVERNGDERLLQVATTLEGVEISGVPA